MTDHDEGHTRSAAENSSFAASTIKEVAQRAGVSAATVSRVLNNYQHVRPGVRQRVALAMRELGYEPDAVARSLRTRNTHTVGFVVNDIANPLFATMAQGVDEVLREYGYTMLLATSGGDAERDRDNLALLRRRRVEGLILAVADETCPDGREELRKTTAPIVLLDRELEGLAVDAVLSDFGPGTRQAIAHLAALGHRRIAFLGGPSSIRPGRERLAAFSGALAAADLAFHPELVKTGSFNPDFGFEQAGALLDSSAPPTALFVGGNQLTVGVFQALRQRRLRLPEDLSLVCCDDLDLLRLGNPPVSVVARPLREIGRLAATLLLERMVEGRTQPRQVVIPTSFVQRASSWPVS